MPAGGISPEAITGLVDINFIYSIITYLAGLFANWVSPILLAVYFHFVIGVLRREIGDLAVVMLLTPAVLLASFAVYSYIMMGEYTFAIYYGGLALLGIALGFLFPRKEKALRSYPL